MIRIEFNPRDLKKIAKSVAEHLREGKIFAIPTDTSYGLAADATNSSAVKRIFQIKNRPHHKPISVFIASKNDIEKYAYIDFLANTILDLLPAKLTIILRAKKSNLIRDLIVYRNTVGLRLPNFLLPRLIATYLGNPITATSANIHGEPPIYDSKDLIRLNIDGFVDAKKLPETPVSTIIDISSGRYLKILRVGSINIKELKITLAKKGILEKYPIIT